MILSTNPNKNNKDNSPEILHESQGLRIRKNKKNSFTVCTLRFEADPKKAEPWWIVEAGAGLPESRVRQEYYIDYRAVSGKKVFPQIDDFQEKIVVRNPYPNLDSWTPCWGGLDFGMNNPTAFIVFTVSLDPLTGEDCIYAVWEHYSPTVSLQDLADVIVKENPYYSRMKWIAGDPHSLWEKQATSGLPTSIADQLAKAGVKKLMPGLVDHTRWIAMMHDHWRQLDSREPSFKIFDNCPNLIREYKNSIYQSISEIQLKTKNYKEKPVDKDNHALDATKYFMNSGPKIKAIRHQPQTTTKKRNPLWMRHMK